MPAAADAANEGEWNVGPALVAGPHAFLRWPADKRRPYILRWPADKPLDTLGALSLPAVSQTLSLSNGSLSNPSKRRRPYSSLRHGLATKRHEKSQENAASRSHVTR